eukprot:g28479.t1
MVPAEGGQGRGGEHVTGGGNLLVVAEMAPDDLLDVDAGGMAATFPREGFYLAAPAHWAIEVAYELGLDSGQERGIEQSRHEKRGPCGFNQGYITVFDQVFLDPGKSLPCVYSLRFGRRKTLLLAFLFTMVAGTLASFSTSYPMFVVFRMLCGVGLTGISIISITLCKPFTGVQAQATGTNWDPVSSLNQPEHSNSFLMIAGGVSRLWVD